MFDLGLTKREIDVMDCLLDGVVVSRASILEQAFGYPSDLAMRMETRSVDITISRIRNKLPDCMSIATVRGIGYRMEVG